MSTGLIKDNAMAIPTTHATDAERMPDAIRQTQPHNGRLGGRETVWGEIDDHCFLLFALHLRFTTNLKPHFETYTPYTFETATLAYSCRYDAT